MDMPMTKEEMLLAKRYIDLSRQAQNKGIITFSDFLNLNELHILHSVHSELYCNFEISGGYECSERQMIAFLPDAFLYDQEIPYPILCCKVVPQTPRFADILTHRDVLGSIMHLGVERSMIGDILVNENEIHIFCHKKVSEFLLRELSKIKHTNIQISIAEAKEMLRPSNVALCEAIITTNRLDSLIAALCKVSRAQAVNLIKSKKVFINNKEVLKTTYICKPEEMISVRSVGRFRFLNCIGETKKGRCKIQYETFI